MSRPRTKIKEVCQNKDCTHYLKETGKDIIKRGINRAGNRQYYCCHCKKYFVNTKGTPMYNRKLSERKIKKLCKELVRKNGVRSVAESVNIDKNTVCSYLNILAKHALVMTNYLVHDLRLSAYEVDELWTFIKKNKKNLDLPTINSLNQAKRLLQRA